MVCMLTRACERDVHASPKHFIANGHEDNDESQAES